MIKYVLAAAMSLALPVWAGSPPVPYVMSGGNYSEGFGDIANWTADFAAGIGAGPWGSVAVNATGAIPDGKKTTSSTVTAPASSSSSTGVQKGTGNLVLLTTGTTENSTAIAVDLFLDFTGRSAGTLSFDWAEINNSTGPREGSIKVYTSTDGSTFTELAAAFVSVTNGTAASGTVASVALPAGFNNSSTARIRFYNYNGGTPAAGAAGSRPKISIDNVAVTSTGTTAPAVVLPPASRTNYVGETATFTVSALDADSYRWYSGITAYTNGGNVSGATSSTLSLTNVQAADASSNITVVLSNAFGFATSAPPVSLTVLPAPQSAFKLLDYNVNGNSIAGTDPTNWATTAPQVQAIGRQLVYLNPDILTLNEIPTAYEFQMTNWVNAFLPGYYLATNAVGDGSIENFIISRFPILSSASHLHGSDLTPFGYTGSGFARDLFEAQVGVPGLGQPLHVFVAHLKATVFTPQDDADKRAAEAGAVSNYFVNVFLPGTNGSHLYLLSGDMNEDIIRPETGSYTSGQPIQKLTNGTGLLLTTPTNPVTGSELTESIRASLNVRFDYILPCATLYSNIISSQVFRTDVLSPLPAGLSNNDDSVSSDHLPLVMLFQNPFAASPPSIITQPVSRTNNQGTTATFSVTAAGANPLVYQWQKGGVNLAEGGNYTGTTNNLLTISNVSQLEEAAYSVVVTNAYGVTNSAVAVLTVVTPAETLALWDFNSVPPDGSSSTGTNAPAAGSGTATLVGGATATFAGGASADPAASDNTGWNTASYPAATTGNKTRGAQFTVSTAGHQKIFISYYEQHSGTASRYMRFQYSTNGTDFIDSDVETFTVSSSFQLQQHDLTGVAGVDNNPNFAFRIMSEFESTAITNANVGYTGTSSTYGTGGTIRFDMMKIEGEPLVAPGVTTPLDVVTQAGNTVSFAVTATGTTPFGYQWRKGVADLANGGKISGATSATLTLSHVSVGDAGGYAVVVTNVVGAVTSSVATLTVTCPAITLAALPGGTTSSNYSHSVVGSGGAAPVTYTNTAGGLPAGLSLSSSGLLSGTPTATGSTNFTVTATDIYGCTSTSNYTLTINCPTITLSTLPNGPPNVPYSNPVVASGGTPAYTYGITGGGLPIGLTLDSSGLLHGMVASDTTTNFTITATDANGCSGSSNYTLTITCPTITLSALPNAAKGVTYSQTVTASGGVPTYAYAKTTGTLPAGLAFNAGTHQLTGKPTNYGAYTFSLQATDTNGCSGSRSYTVLVSKTGGDTTAPKVKFLTPKPNQVVTNPPMTVSGKVSDDVLVTNVVYWLDTPTSSPSNAPTTQSATDFTINLGSLPGGVHTVIVQATDLSGNQSVPTAVTFNYGEHSFLPQAGTYYGLVSEAPDNVRYVSAGFARVIVTAKPGKLPTFSLALKVGGKKWGGAGTFTLDGVATLKKPIDRGSQSLPSLTARLVLPTNGLGTISGSLYNTNTLIGAWTSVLDADLAVTNKLPVAGTTYDGTYTLVVPGFGPEIGDGIGLLVVTNGTVKLTGGKLADNQGFTQTGLSLSGNGDWPLFSASDTSGGISASLIMGWVNISAGHAVTTSNLVWIKGTTGSTYQSGFATNVSLHGCSYPGDPAGNHLLIPLTGVNLTSAKGNVYLTSGLLGTNIVNSIVLTNDGTKNKFIDTLASKTNKQNNVVLSLTGKSGRVAGKFKAPGDGVAAAAINAVTLVSSNLIDGYFLPTDGHQSGKVEVKP